MSEKNYLKELVLDELGATAIEYGLIAALIVIAMVTALQGVANETINMWGNVETKMSDAVESSQP